MTHVLRKSIGPYSAGTQVYPHEEGFHIIMGSDEYIITDPSLVVQRRQMSMMVPLKNAKQRRKTRKALAELTQLSQEQPGGYR